MIRHIIPPIPAELLAEVAPWTVATTAEATARGILRGHVVELLDQMQRGHRDAITAKLNRMADEYSRWAQVVERFEAEAAEAYWEAA